MKLGGVSSAEAALALVRAFGYTGAMSADLTLRDVFDDPEHIPSWRHPAGPMHLDWDDSEAVTPVVFVGDYRTAPSSRSAPATRVEPVDVAPWLVSTPRALFELLSLS